MNKKSFQSSSMVVALLQQLQGKISIWPKNVPLLLTQSKGLSAFSFIFLLFHYYYFLEEICMIKFYIFHLYITHKIYFILLQTQNGSTKYSSTLPIYFHLHDMVYFVLYVLYYMILPNLL